MLVHLASRARCAKQLLFPSPPPELAHTEVLAFIASALQCNGPASVAPLHDADELCAFAREHQTLAEAWDECHRVDWLLYLLDRSQQLGLVEGHDLPSLVNRFQVTRRDTTSPSWLIVMQVQAHGLRQVTGNPLSRDNTL